MLRLLQVALQDLAPDDPWEGNRTWISSQLLSTASRPAGQGAQWDHGREGLRVGDLFINFINIFITFR